MSNQTHIYIKFVSEPFIIFIYAFQYQDKKYEIRNWLAFKKKKKKKKTHPNLYAWAISVGWVLEDKLLGNQMRLERNSSIPGQ